MQAQPDPRLEQARRFIKDKRHNEARAILVDILKTNPNDVTSLYLYAHVARNWQESEKVLKRVLELDPLNYQARAALNKIQNRSVEQQQVEAAAFEPASASEDNVLPPMQVDRSAASPTEARRQPQKAAADSGSILPYLAASAFLVLVGLAVVAMLLLSGNDDDPEVDNGGNNSQNGNSNNNGGGGINIVDVTEVGELPPTWTPSPTPTIRASRTIAPSSTPFPTRTPYPTLEPTEPTVEAFEINVGTLSRLYYDYTDLAAQLAWAEDDSTFDRLEAAFQAMIDSLALTEYAQDEDLDEEWVTYLDQLVILLQQQIDLANSRQNSASVSEDDMATLTAQNLEQIDTVELQLFSIVSAATATQSFEQQIDFLRTPSVTPIFLAPVTPVPLGQ